MTAKANLIKSVVAIKKEIIDTILIIVHSGVLGNGTSFM